MFREALKTGWYDLLLARDAYRVAAGEHGLHRELIARFLEVRPSAGVSGACARAPKPWRQ